MAAIITTKNFRLFTWSDVYIPTRDDITEVATRFGISTLLIADSVQSGHLPKYEKTSGYTFLMLRGLTPDCMDQNTTSITTLSNKITILYKSDEVITIHGGDFHFLHAHIKDTYQTPEDLMLAIVRSTFATYDTPSTALRTSAEKIEAQIFLHNTSKVTLENVYFQKTRSRIGKNLLKMNQEVLEHVCVEEVLKSELQDIKEVLTHHISSFSELHENANNILTTYLSINAQKNNDVVRVLTIFSAFFLPLTFIVGIYGMNFKVFPELDWYYGYPVSMAIMFAVCVLIYLWFRKKGFL
jgi:magnesium transporter